MHRLLGIPAINLALHPIAGANHELTLSPLQHPEEEYCRFHEPSGRFIHLYPDRDTNSIVMVISPNRPPTPIWQLYIYMDLWTRGELQRTAQGIEPLFEFHPLGWGSEVHQAKLNVWGAANGVRIVAVPGLIRRLYIW